MRLMKTIFPIIACFSAATIRAQSQEPQPFRNAVKINISSSLLYNNPVILSYERIVRPTQSFTVYGGYLQFPSLVGLDANGMEWRKSHHNDGWTTGGEYRFYLRKENKHAAPHGVYIGPYVNYYQFSNSRDTRMTDGSGTEAVFRSRIRVFNAGAQLGYQFVLAKRIVLDLILLAPSIASYDLKFSLDGNIDPDQKHERFSEVLDRMKDRFPLMNKLADGATIDVNGHSTTWAPGFRYTLQVGYLFGKK